MLSQSSDNSTRNGTLCGTLSVLWFQVNWSDLFQAAIIAAVGACSSFLVSLLLRFISKKLFGKPPE